MAHEALAALVRVNLAASAAILAVLLLRGPVRAWFGARAAYGLWLIAPLAAFASLLPARVVHDLSETQFAPAFVRGALEALAAATGRLGAQLDAQGLAIGWAVGAACALIWLAWRQSTYIDRLGRLEEDYDGETFFLRAEAGHGGPALIGAFTPRIVLPCDFEARFEAEERKLIIAHEQTHLRAGDALVNAAAALLSALFWFNPLAHLAAYRLRLDQELACDCDVAAQYPRERGRYARALLKTHFATQSVPLGCAWPARGAHPLRARVAVLSRPLPNARRRLAGAILVTLLCLCGGAAAWGAQAPVYRPTPAQTWSAFDERAAVTATMVAGESDAELSVAQPDGA